MHDNEEWDEDGFDGPSKSELKRQQKAVQDLIAEVISQPKAVIENLPAEDQCMRELRVAAAMAPSSSRNRQIRYVSKLVGKQPGLVEELQNLLEKTKLAKQQSANQLHEMEYWRDRILQGEDQDIFEFSAQFDGSDQQQLRQLCREFRKFSKTGDLSTKQQATAATKCKEIQRKVFKLVSQTIRNANAG